MSQDENAVNTEVVADTTTTDSAPVETESPEVVETSDIEAGFDGDESTTEPEEEAEETESTEEESTEEPAEEEQPRGKAEERKTQLNTEIRDLVQTRNQLRQEVERLNSQAYPVASEEELMNQGYSQLEATVEAMRQAQEAKAYNEQVADAQLTLTSEAQKALQDFPMFDAESPQYNPEVAKQADQLLGANLVFDPNTQQVIGSHVSPYQLYKTIASAMQVSEVTGQAKAQKATEQMLANADTTSSTAPPKAKSDPLLEGFDEYKI